MLDLNLAPLPLPPIPPIEATALPPLPEVPKPAAVTPAPLSGDECGICEEVCLTIAPEADKQECKELWTGYAEGTIDEPTLKATLDAMFGEDWPSRLVSGLRQRGNASLADRLEPADDALQ